ncbi:MAG: HU family DNA-binding protein [Desulfobacteraceae bacterium]|nr:HU family DNA-binding protein [Desulfobacteraceae bacterium]
MNKTDLIVAVANATEISKATASKSIAHFLEAITNALVTEGKVTISGFGTFAVVERAPRAGRNLRTGKRLTIPARNVVRFKTGKRLADSIG